MKIISFTEPEKQALFEQWYAENKSSLIEEFLYQWNDVFKDFVRDNFEFCMAMEKNKHSEPDWDDLYDESKEVD